MITIIDYKMGNLGSIQNMLIRIGEKSIITNNIKDIEKANKIILPGVGSFDKAINNLNALNLIEIIKRKANDEKIPILGICLGMQLLSEKSEEGILTGLALIQGEVKKFNFMDPVKKYKIPHMGWNIVKKVKSSPLTDNIAEDSRFYFVHAYHFVCYRETDILLTTDYGYEFVSAVANDNILGVQFHPEKSHRFGMQLLKNFVELY